MDKGCKSCLSIVVCSHTIFLGSIRILEIKNTGQNLIEIEAKQNMRYIVILVLISNLLQSKNSSNPKDGAEMVFVSEGLVEVGIPEQQIERVQNIYRNGLQIEPKLGWLTRERPLKTKRIKAFWIYKYEVTNKMFARFIKETNYRTRAEREGYGYVMGARTLRKVRGASWRRPKGPGSSWQKYSSHPVVQVCLEDVKAYANWAKVRIPTEAEWIKAASGGVFRLYPWGNFWRDGFANCGRYPELPVIDAVDGYSYSSPVGHYKKGVSPYQCYDMAGNVWEWTKTLSKTEGIKKLYAIKGGAWFSNLFCLRISCKARVSPSFRCNGLGFRLVKDESK